MRPSTLHGLVGHLCRLAAPPHDSDLSDADLLEHFRRQREEAAFTLLVQRHGPMVLALCRRLLGEAHHAEDAFQATFLVLVRKAPAIRKRPSLAAWLHGVASRIARRARAQLARQRARDRTAPPSAAPADPSEMLADRELRAALDEEIQRLPDKYRVPLVLCYLADRTHEQIARELGWPKSTVTARLARARQMLQRRLVCRGFTAPAGLLAALLIEQAANATVPALLTLSTVRLAAQTLRGEALAATSTVALADTFLRGAAFTKWAAVLALLATIGLAAAGHWLMAGTPPPRHDGLPPAASAPGGPREPKAEQRKPRVDLLGDPLPEGVVARMGSGRLRHPGGWRALAFSPDGKWIVSGGAAGHRIGGIRFWDAATGRPGPRFDVDDDWTLGLAFTAEGIAVASSGYERGIGIVTVQVADPASGKVRRRVEMSERASVANLTFSPGGKRIAFSSSPGNSVAVCDPVTGQKVAGFSVAGRMARDLAFSPDGKTIAVADLSDTIPIHDAATGQLVRRLRRDKDSVWNVRFSPDGRFLASIPGSDRDPGEICIWDLKTGEERHRWKSPSGRVLSAAFSPDGKHVAVGSQHRDLVLWDLSSGKEVRRYPTDAFFGEIAFSPDGKALAAISGEGIIRLWETATGRVLPASADPFINTVHNLRFSRDGRRLLGSGATYVVWDPATGREIHRFSQVSERRWPLALSPDESLLAATEPDGTIRLWDAATGKEAPSLKGHEKWVYALAFAADGRRLCSSGFDGTIRVWDVASGRELWKLAGQGDWLAVSPDGRRLASTSGHAVALWDLETGRQQASLAMASRNTPHQLAFSPDGRWLAAVNGGGRRDDPGEVKVWEVAGGKEWYSLEGHKTRASSVAFSPDGRTLATGDMQGTLFLWELATGRRRHQFVGHESWIRSLAFSPDGRLLAVSSAEAPVYVWDVLGTRESTRGRLSPEDLRRCWMALAADDAPAAFQAIRRLAAAPEQTLALLRELLKAVPEPDAKRVRRLVEALDSNEFQERQDAAAELEKRADAAASILRQMAKEASSLNVRRTLQQILEGLETAPEALRAVRAVEVLEWIATPEADRLLGELAKGAADARLTREAAAAHQRRR
jgi:RNA polymerase sigma factor (sigma-70 family)